MSNEFVGVDIAKMQQLEAVFINGANQLSEITELRSAP